jgi:hypothetical protein
MNENDPDNTPWRHKISLSHGELINAAGEAAAKLREGRSFLLSRAVEVLAEELDKAMALAIAKNRVIERLTEESARAKVAFASAGREVAEAAGTFWPDEFTGDGVFGCFATAAVAAAERSKKYKALADAVVLQSQVFSGPARRLAAAWLALPGHAGRCECGQCRQAKEVLSWEEIKDCQTAADVLKDAAKLAGWARSQHRHVAGCDCEYCKVAMRIESTAAAIERETEGAKDEEDTAE